MPAGIAGSDAAAATAEVVDELLALHADALRCAQFAGLRYVTVDRPGITRRRCGRGFTYYDAKGRLVPAEQRKRLDGLAVPPAWREVWICPRPDGHLQASGVDDRGRRQYLYHQRWRDVRDLINFYRLVPFGQQLPTVRSFVTAQLRRRTLDKDRLIAAMLRIVDVCSIRVSSEVYAEENGSHGLSTLARRHVHLGPGGLVHLDFPAKGGQRTRFEFRDRGVARVLAELEGGRRLFRVDGTPIDADMLNARLAELTAAQVTAKDYRTWAGTRAAYRYICDHPQLEPDDLVLGAVDAAAARLRNTRAVARAHYVHPHLLEAVADGSFAQVHKPGKPAASPGLSPTEAGLLRFLTERLIARREILASGTG